MGIEVRPSTSRILKLLVDAGMVHENSDEPKAVDALVTAHGYDIVSWYAARASMLRRFYSCCTSRTAFRYHSDLIRISLMFTLAKKHASAKRVDPDTMRAFEQKQQEFEEQAEQLNDGSVDELDQLEQVFFGTRRHFWRPPPRRCRCWNGEVFLFFIDPPESRPDAPSVVTATTTRLSRQ